MDFITTAILSIVISAIIAGVIFGSMKLHDAIYRARTQKYRDTEKLNTLPKSNLRFSDIPDEFAQQYLAGNKTAMRID